MQVSKHLVREEEDEEDLEIGLGGRGAVEMEDPSQPGHDRHESASSRKHQREDAEAAAKLMREWSDVQIKVGGLPVNHGCYCSCRMSFDAVPAAGQH